MKLTQSGTGELVGHVHGMAAEVVELTGRLSDDERRVVGRFLDDMSELLARSPTPRG